MKWLLALLLLAGCGRTIARLDPPTLQEIQLPAGLTVSAHVAPDSSGALAGYLDFTNRTAAPIEVTHGACAFAVQLSAADDSAPIWQSVPPGERACIMIARTLVVPANGTESVVAGRFAGSDELPRPPRGPHRAAVLFNGGVLRRVPAGSIDIP